VKCAWSTKSAFPRDKLCGGLLTLRSKKTFQKIFNGDGAPVIQKNPAAPNLFISKTAQFGRRYKDIFFTCRRELIDYADPSG